ncbi:MAG: hypothetical protein E6H07_02765 [Bacteroidetes bacterium]|nr:MAG: hypothetical protein E6H07_02765 [Bacteroidota bacterium]
MKHFFLKSFMTAAVVASAFVLSSFKSVKNEKKPTANCYTIELVSNNVVGTNFEWTWRLSNPNPGNGLNETLQNVSHWDIPLGAQAEAALVSAEYSFDGITWTSVSIEMDRDPSIKTCTTNDVLKFNAGTVGAEPTYYRATFSREFPVNPNATSYIKAGVRQGCNTYYYSGVGIDAAPRND